jgi:hypothetical protein
MLKKLVAIVFVLLSAAPLRAEDSIFIDSPAAGVVVAPGQTVSIVMRQASGLSPVYFNESVGLLPSPLFAEQTVQSVDPYVISIRIKDTARSGDYQIVGIVKRQGAGAYVETKPLLLRVQSSAIKAISFPSRSVLLRFPGDSVALQLDAYDAGGSYIPLSMNDRGRLTWIVDDPTVVAVSQSGEIVALKRGAARVSTKLDGLQGVLDVVVEAPSVRGDLNGDNTIDSSDLAIIRAAINKSVQVQGDSRDINGDGKIDALDLRVLTTLCSRPRCAAQ